MANRTYFLTQKEPKRTSTSASGLAINLGDFEKTVSAASSKLLKVMELNNQHSDASPQPAHARSSASTSRPLDIGSSPSSFSYPSDQSLYRSWYGLDGNDNESLLSSSIPNSHHLLSMEDVSQDEGITSSSDQNVAYSHARRPRSPSFLSGLSSPQSEASANISRPISPRELPASSQLTSSDLVMPYVSLPSNKPFTESGLRLGKIKILIAGNSATGKTTLVDSLISLSNDIVHVDGPMRAETAESTAIGAAIVETTASSKPLPLFRSVSSGSSGTSVSTSKRPSLVHSESTSNESALDRNICFVDTAGYGAFDDPSTCIDAVASYLEDKFTQTAGLVNISHQKQASNLISTASSLNEFTHTDACFYLVSGQPSPTDIEFIKSIGEFTPIIPVIAMSDNIASKEELVSIKTEMLKILKKSNITPFLFDTSIDDAIAYGEQQLQHMQELPNTGEQDGQDETSLSDKATNSSDDELFIDPLLFPCAVSNLRDDREDMLASVLMAPEYRSPLISSELRHLLQYVLSEPGAGWLRYETAKCFSRWCVNFQINSSLIRLGPSQFNGLVPAPQYYTQTVRSNSQVNPSEDYDELQFTIPAEYNINLPTGLKDRAQHQTARWVMQLEQASRTDNAISLRARTAVTARRRSERANLRRPGHQLQENEYSLAQPNGKGAHNTQQPNGKISDSIHNVDPLGLRFVPQQLLSLLVRAASVLAGVKLLSSLVASRRTVVAAPVISTIQPVPERWQDIFSDTFDSLSHSGYNIVVSALNSLGGGWSTIVVNA